MRLFKYLNQISLTVQLKDYLILIYLEFNYHLTFIDVKYYNVEILCCKLIVPYLIVLKPNLLYLKNYETILYLISQIMNNLFFIYNFIIIYK
jgi:hypothetical protein